MNIAETTSEGTPDVAILAVSGRIDGSHADELSERLLARIEAGQRHFVVDLADVDYVSSVGLRSFVVVAKRLAALGGRIALCGPQPQIQRVFQVVRFTSIVPIVADQQAAIECVRRSS